MQPISFVLELDEEEKKLLATWMMIVQEQLERKDKHYAMWKRFSSGNCKARKAGGRESCSIGLQSLAT